MNIPRAHRPHTLTVAVATLAALTLGLAACSSDSGDDAATTTTVATDTSATDSTAEVVSDEGGLTIAGPWARTSPASSANGAVYVELTSADGDRLVGASVPGGVAATVELHETSGAMDDEEMGTDTTMGDMGSDDTTSGSDTTMSGMGEMTMQPVDAIELPAGEVVALEPGGYHVMLLDLVEPLEEGQEIELTLTFDQAGERTISVPVRDDAP